ncbi:MAG: hypothetical protein UX75_C0046G0006, partial [Candidatus Moranbacteria bacterium GW2011_GWE2_47_10]
LVATASSALVSSFACVLTVRFFQTQKWAAVPLMLMLSVFTFFSANKLSLFAYQFFTAPEAQTDMSSLPPLEELPYLGIKLSRPLKNRHYRIDGPVPSIELHEKKVFQEFGFPFVDAILAEKEYDVIRGNCQVLRTLTHKIAVTTWLEKGELINSFIAAHEEMHVVQKLGVMEAYRDIRSRFGDLGYDISFVYFSLEEQANIAAALVFLEKGWTLREIRRDLTQDSETALRKLELFKRKNYPRQKPRCGNSATGFVFSSEKTDPAGSFNDLQFLVFFRKILFDQLLDFAAIGNYLPERPIFTIHGLHEKILVKLETLKRVFRLGANSVDPPLELAERGLTLPRRS